MNVNLLHGVWGILSAMELKLYLDIYLFKNALCVCVLKSLITLVRISTFFISKFVNIFLSISLNMCFGCSKEPFH